MLTSPFAKLHNAIIERITTMVPEIRFIDQDLGQLENYDIRPAVSWPCILMDVSDDWNYSEQGNKAHQMAEGSVLIRLALVKYTDTTNITPANRREAGLQYYELEHKLVAALHNWAPEGFGKMLRRKATTEKREDDIRVRALPFACSFIDTVAAPATQKISRPEPIIAGIGTSLQAT